MKRAALCIIGSELTRGVIQDSHGQMISSDLTRIGYDVREIVIVPDDGSIRRVLHRLAGEVDLVVTTGGLGPTSDDITRDAVADIAGVSLAIDADARAVLADRVGNDLNAANLRQVMIPEGFTVLPNPVGTAPGFCRSGEFYALPGPPRELLTMWKDEVLPDLMGRQGSRTPEERLEATVFLIPESLLEESCTEAARRTADSLGLADTEMPIWGTRAQLYRISLYLQGSSDTIRRAVLSELKQLLGPELVREGDVEAVDLLYTVMREQKLMVAGAESCTGGLAGKLLTDVAGSSQFFWGSMVTYANSAKTAVLGVKESALQESGAVSQQTVEEMALGVLRISGADAAFSISGIAGPGGGTDEKPVGTVWFGFASSEGLPQSVCITFHPYSRGSVRRRAAICAFLLLEQYLKGRKLLDIIQSWQYSKCT